MEIYDPDTYARELMSSLCKRDDVSYASSTEPIHTEKELENETNNRIEEYREYNTSDTSSILR